MSQSEHELLDLLKFDLIKFEQYFLDDGSNRRSPHTPLMGFVPSGLGDRVSPRRLIRHTGEGETIDYFYRCGTQLELEEALAGWLREQRWRRGWRLQRLLRGPWLPEQSFLRP